VNDIERRQRRLDYARFAVRAELAIGFAVALYTWFWFIAAPGFFRPMFYQPSLFEQLVPWVAVCGPVIGLAWMIRLARPTSEDGKDSWRFRDQTGAVTASGRHHRARRLWLLLLLVSAVVALGLFGLINGTMSHGGMSYWWDGLGPAVRDLMRGIWSNLTGQPMTQDLFHF
jgi:hypothetical protein